MTLLDTHTQGSAEGYNLDLTVPRALFLESASKLTTTALEICFTFDGFQGCH